MLQISSSGSLTFILSMYRVFCNKEVLSFLSQSIFLFLLLVCCLRSSSYLKTQTLSLFSSDTIILNLILCMVHTGTQIYFSCRKTAILCGSIIFIYCWEAANVMGLGQWGTSSQVVFWGEVRFCASLDVKVSQVTGGCKEQVTNSS